MKKYIFYLILLALSLHSCRQEKNQGVGDDIISQVENNLLPKIIIEGEEQSSYNILERMEHYNVPGVSIAYMDSGQFKWAKGYGYADLEKKIKVTEKTLFQAASISKPVTAMAALMLVEEGKIGLDEDVNMYLEDWQVEENEFTASEKVTLRRILSHSAGLTVHGFGGYASTDTIPDIISILDGEDPANSGRIYPDVKPGTIYRYSGGGYTVMQKMICDMLGKDFPSLMEEMVLCKLGMTNSSYIQPLPEDRYHQAAHAYRNDGSPVEGMWHSYPEMAAAGLWTTPADLIKYAIGVFNSYHGKTGSIISRDMAGQMLTPQINSHGLGPQLSGSEDHRAFGHGGSNEGFKCSLFVFRDKGEGVAIMTNGDNGGKLCTEILRSFSKIMEWPDNRYKPLTLKVQKMSEEELQEYVGEYLLEIDNEELIISLSAEDGYLSGVQLWNDFLFKIYPDSEDHFFGFHDGAPFEFSRDDAGAILKVRIREGSNTFTFKKK